MRYVCLSTYCHPWLAECRRRVTVIASSVLPPLRSLAEMAAATSVHVVTIIEPIIIHADWFFPDGRTQLQQNFPLNFPLLSVP